jgi:pimeloyl-ACP methyl ester carboxylesterase
MLHPSIRHERVAANGLNFHVLAAGQGDRLALFLHGFPELAFSWRHQLPVLAEEGWLAWAPDLRGYGETDRPVGRDEYAIEKLMDDVAGLIDASGARETLLIAHDWGGVVAWLFAIRKIRPLARLAVLNLPHPACFERALSRGCASGLRSWYVLFFQIPWLPEEAVRHAQSPTHRRRVQEHGRAQGELPRRGARRVPARRLQPGAHTR